MVKEEIIVFLREVVDCQMLRKAGCEVKLTTYPDTDHDSRTDTYKNLEIYEWSLSHQDTLS